MIIEKAMLSDAEEILSLQKLAYISEAKIYKDYTIEPLVQPLKEIKTQFEDHIFIKALSEGVIVGSVRGHLKEKTCYIGKLIVHSNYQNQGIGKNLMSQIELVFNNSLKYELFTGSKSRKNIYLYEKIGYKRFKTEIISTTLSMIFFSKTNHCIE